MQPSIRSPWGVYGHVLLPNCKDTQTPRDCTKRTPVCTSIVYRTHVRLLPFTTTPAFWSPSCSATTAVLSSMHCATSSAMSTAGTSTCCTGDALCLAFVAMLLFSTPSSILAAFGPDVAIWSASPTSDVLWTVGAAAMQASSDGEESSSCANSPLRRGDGIWAWPSSPVSERTEVASS